MTVLYRRVHLNVTIGSFYYAMQNIVKKRQKYCKLQKKNYDKKTNKKLAQLVLRLIIFNLFTVQAKLQCRLNPVLLQIISASISSVKNISIFWLFKFFDTSIFLTVLAMTGLSV